MESPELAPVPSAEILGQLLPDELQNYVEAWLALIKYHLLMGETAFKERGESVATFLKSYFSLLSSPSSSGVHILFKLKQQAFLLSHRALSLDDVPNALLHWSFLTSLCQQFMHSQSLQEILNSVWRRKHEIVEASVEATKQSIISSKIPDQQKKLSLEELLNRVAPLIQTIPNVGEVLCTGSDFLDTLIDIFPKASDPLKKSIVVIVYLSLLSLLREEHHNVSLLHDQLYALKANGDTLRTASLIAAVVSDTPLISKFAVSPLVRDRQRTLSLVESLREFRHASSNQRLRRKKRDKGKGAAREEYGHGFDSVHVHRMSLISQIQDLFPDLGTAFIAKLLSEYEDDVEKATSHLLEDSLPASLAAADRTDQLPHTDGDEPHVDFSPAPTPPLERRNVFDDDELDRLHVDASRLHIGKKDREEEGEVPNKAAILSALAAFDSDDDERDDTYDVEDVGGTVDTSNPEADSVGVDDKNEEALYKAYKLDPKVFDRDAMTRRSRARMALKSETSLTDEAIEGWLVVNARDPRKMRRLEAKYSTWTGQQHELAPTAWRQSPAASGAEDSEEGTASRGGRGRGRPRGGYRGRGGNAAGPADEKGTQQARQRKEANKGSRANHNRRDQRARKTARGGFGGGAG